MARVILVAHSRADRLRISKGLVDLGHTVTALSNGNDAIRLLSPRHRDNFQLLITAIDLPGQSGYRIVKFVREEIPLMPIIALCALVEHVNRLPPDVFIVMKPYDLAFMRDIVPIALDHRLDWQRKGGDPLRR